MANAIAMSFRAGNAIRRLPNRLFNLGLFKQDLFKQDLFNRCRGIFALTMLTVAMLAMLAGCSTQKSIATHDVGPAIDGNNLSIDRILIMSAAKDALGTPYQWGGSTPRGYDCSGLVQMAYGQIGISLPRTSNDQYRALRDIDVARPGDLLFFGSGSRATHVGIYMGDRQMIHAPGSGRTVTVSSLDVRYWRKHFMGAAAPAD